MFSISAVKARFKRSGIDFNNTFLWEDIPSQRKNFLHELLNDEIGILYFEKSLEYRWILTNQRLILMPEINVVMLSSLIKVDIIDIKNNPQNKMTNSEINLFTEDGNFVLFVEEKGWHVIFKIFQFIVFNNLRSKFEIK